MNRQVWKPSGLGPQATQVQLQRPDSALPYVNLAEIAAFSNRLPQAIALLKQAIDIATRAGLTKPLIEDFIERFLGVAAMVPDRRIEAISADPDDDKYLSAAREGVADFVVSGDHHLLDLQFYDRVRIVSPRRFLEVPGP